ncbi:MAG: hypothetical protein ABR915_23400 [Thermoguttaceae bacterium]|jgi:hypothetical protein
MALSRFWSAALLFALLQILGGTPPWTPGPITQTPPRQPENRFPVDEQRAPQQGKPKFDAAQLKRDAEELSKLAQAIPPGVEQANKGVISKDLNDRLKRIEKLSKQLRRELFQ